jgi:quinol monooxygenase YgiN
MKEGKRPAWAFLHEHRKPRAPEVTTMTIVRIIYASFPPDQAEKARANWKEKCAPLMIRQPGCMSEELLRCTDRPGEFIPYAEWDSMDHIQQYLQSEGHQEIKRLTATSPAPMWS